MKLGNIEISFNKSQQEAPPTKGDFEASYADSSYYEKYQLRPYNPSDLYQKRGDYSIYDKMLEDDQISSILTLKKIMILESEWTIECEDQKVSEFLTDCLNEFLDDTFLKKMFEILSAMDYGFSVTEKIYGPADTKYGKKIVFQKLKTRAPHTFELHTDVFGNVEKIIQHTGHGDIQLDPNKFILFTHNKKFDNPYGTSDLNVGVYRAWWSKDAIIKFWNIYLERFGMPTVVGTVPRTLGEAERSRLKQVVTNIQAKTGIVLSDDVKMDLLKTSGGKSDYENAIDKYNLMIARAFLFPDLLGFSGGQTSGGSYSLGQEQFDIFYKTIDYGRQDVCRVVNREIINPLVAWNFGNNVHAEFKFQKIDHDRKAEDMRVWLEAVISGKIPITDHHVNWFLAQVNAPEIEEKELAEINEKKEEIRQQISGNKNQEKEREETTEKGDDDDSEDDKDSNDDQKKFEKSSIFSRPPTRYESKVNFSKINADWETTTEEYKKKLADAFTLVINGLLNDIKKKKIIEKRALQQVNKLDLRNYRKIDLLFRDMMRDSYKNGSESAKEEIPKQFAIGTPTGLDNEDVIEWLEQSSFYMSGVEKEEILKKAKGILFESIRNGNGARETVRQLSDAFKGYNIQIGRTELESASRVETIVRTNVQRAFNEARAQQFNEIADDIRAYQYSAILDGRTSPLCERLDEKIFQPSELEYYNPPNHYRCRSLIVPIFNDEEIEGFSDMPATVQEKGSFLMLKK